MPSSVIAQVSEIKNIRVHDGADRLEIAEINGWQIVCGKGHYTSGDRVVFITPDSLITEELAEILEIKQFLSSVKNQDGSFVTNEKGQVMMRVRQVKLRGEPSFGTTIPAEVILEYFEINIDELELGTNLAEELGILKYEPAMKSSAGDAEVDHPLFGKYTNIENLRNYPSVFKDVEEVILTLKYHGSNCRVGVIDGEIMAGSHSLRRKRPENMETNTYWYPYTLTPVKNLLESLGTKHKQVILFGEVYGNVQKKYDYGIPGRMGFSAFDLYIDGRYLNYDEFKKICEEFGVPTVLEIARIPYSYEKVVNLVESIEKDPIGNHPMEGVVIKPIVERHNEKVGRTILKYLSNKYLFDNKKGDSLDR